MTEINYNTIDKTYDIISLDTLVQGSSDTNYVKVWFGTYVDSVFTADTTLVDDTDLQVGGIFTRPDGTTTWRLTFVPQTDGSFLNEIDSWDLEQAGTLYLDIQKKVLTTSAIDSYSRVSLLIHEGTYLDEDTFEFTLADYDNFWFLLNNKINYANLIEVATYDDLPETGVTGIIYSVLDTLKNYRWNGTDYIFIYLTTRTIEEINTYIDAYCDTCQDTLETYIDAKVAEFNPMAFNSATEAEIEFLTANNGIYVASDTGYIYVWSDTNSIYKQGALLYDPATVALLASANTFTGNNSFKNNVVFPQISKEIAMNIDNASVDITALGSTKYSIDNIKHTPNNGTLRTYTFPDKDGLFATTGDTDALDTRVTTNEGDIAEILDGTQAVGITNALNGDIVNYGNLNKTILGNSYNIITSEEVSVTNPGFDFTTDVTSPVELRFKFNIVLNKTLNHYVYPYIRYRNSGSYKDTLLPTIQTTQTVNEPVVIDKTITTTLSNILTYKIYFTGSNTLELDLNIENLEIYADGVKLDVGFTANDYTTDTSEDISYLATKAWVDENYVGIETTPTYDIASMVLPNFYNVFDDSANPQNLTYSIFIDYMLTDDFNDALFSNGSDHYNIYQNLTQTEDVETETKTLSFSSDSATIADTDINIISTKASVQNIDTRILVIGDSVTDGYGAEGETYHNQLYKRIKEEDVNFSRTTNIEFLGIRNVTYSFNYLGNSYSKLICDEGRSGWGLVEYYKGDFTTDRNPFYDGDLTTDCKFSINKWIERYRTMDDTGTRLAIGDATLGTEITSANLNTINVATPNIVVINLGHNDFYRYSISRFFTYYEEILAKIREELPNAYIIVMVTMPLLYCYHKEFYPNYETEDTSKYDSVNYYNRYRENAVYWKNFVSTNTDDKILVLPEFNITPTINSYRWEIQENYMGENTYKYNHYYGHAHPYIPAHNIWGYQLYAMYKYIMKLEEV